MILRHVARLDCSNMDPRIPPDRPRRPASSDNLHTAPEALPAQPEQAEAPQPDSVHRASAARPALTAAATPTLPAPGATAAQLRAATSTAHPPRTPAEHAAMALFMEVGGERLVGDIDATVMQRLSASALEASTLRGSTAGFSEELFARTRNILMANLLSSIGQSPAPASTPEDQVELRSLQAALADVGAWYGTLDPTKTEAVWVNREDDFMCGISQKPFAELEHPVAVRTGPVASVFEAEDLLRWMLICVEHPSNHGKATNPVDRTPIHLRQLTKAVNVFFGPVGPAQV